LIDAAHAAGIPVISRIDLIDPNAARVVPADLGVVGIRWHEGFLIVAWPSIPSPAEVTRVQARVGVPIVPAIAPGIHDALRLAASQISSDRPPIERVLDAALGKRASDIHLTVGVPPMIRAGHELIPLPMGPLSRDDLGPWSTMWPVTFSGLQRRLRRRPVRRLRPPT
jgi:hypothetical protein